MHSTIAASQHHSSNIMAMPSIGASSSTDYQSLEDDSTVLMVGTTTGGGGVGGRVESSLVQKEENLMIDLKSSSPTPQQLNNNNMRSFWFIFFWLCALLTHLIMSTNQVISRYLLHYGGKQTAIQPYTLLCLSNLGALILYTPRMLYKYGRVSVFENCRNNIRQAGGLGKLLYRHRKVMGMLCLYQLSIVFGSSLREFATFFTSSTYVQLVLLSSPFIIVFMGILVFKTETFSWFDLMTLFFTVTGAVIIILASATRVTEDENGNPVAYQWKWWPDFSQIGRGFKWPNDFIGMIIALLSSFFFSMKLNAVNKLAPSKTGEEKPSMIVHPSSYSMSKEGYEASSALVVNGSEDVVFAVDPSKSSSSLSTLPVLPSSPSLREKVLMVETQSSMALVSAQSNGELYHEDSILMETQSQASDESAHSGASIEAPLLSSRYRVALHDSETATTKETLEDPKSIEPQQSREEENYVAPEISPEDLFYIQKYLLVLWPIIPMCLYEDWTVFTRYNTVRWLMFIWFMIMNRLVAAVLELWCAKEIGSSNYSIMFPIRIVIGLILSSVVLGEWIDNLVSILGCLIVVAAITAFSIKKHSK